MAARSLASIRISFGLVSIPVKLYTATTPAEGIHFNFIHERCGSRVRQQYFCIKEDVPVDRSELVKGYEFSKDQYVIFTKDELKAVEEAATQTVEIAEFLPAESIDPVYYDKAYYLAPDKGGAKPYALLAESMRQSGRTAIGRYAARGKQYIVQLRVTAQGLVMQQLLYADEVRTMDELGVEQPAVKPAELKLAMQLIDQISTDRFEPEQYRDEVKERIEAAVREKVEGKEITVGAEAPETGGEVIDLMEALRASLGGGAGGARKAAAANEPAATEAPAKSAATKSGAAAKKTARKPAKAAPAPARPATARPKVARAR